MKQQRWTNVAYESIMHMLGAHTGLDFRPNQRESTEQGIDRAMTRSSAGDVLQYARLLECDDQTLDDLIVELTVGETYFFREPLQFEYIRRHILAEIRAVRGPEHIIRIWSAACASGEEPYSLAILCEEEGLGQSSDILATDISSAALAKARDARYSEWSLRSEGGTRSRDYLHLKDGEYHLQERIRSRVRFEFLNLALDVYPSWITGTRARDLILCRNVLIYFDRDTVRAVAARLYDCLADGGWLLLASGDPSIDDYAPFETVVTDAGVFYRKPRPQPAQVAETTSREQLSQGREAFTSPTVPDRSRNERSVEAPRSVANQNAPNVTLDPLTEARTSLAEGDYARTVELTEPHLDDPSVCVLQVKALANIDTQHAASQCGQLAQRHPLLTELHYLHGVLLMELNQDDEASQAVQRAVFLDRTLAIAHFLLGSILQRRGQLEGAERSFRNARNLCVAAPPNDMVALSEHETNGQLAQAAEMHLATIEAAIRRRS